MRKVLLLTSALSVFGGGAYAQTCSLGSVAYTASGGASSQVLQDANGNPELVIWNEAGGSSTVNLGTTYSTVQVFDPTKSATTPVQTLSNVSSIPLSLGTGPLIVKLGSPVAGAATNSSVPTVKAQTAGSFVSSIGVNTHIGYTGTVYGNVAQVQQELAYLGITNVRDQAPNSANLSSYQQLASAGVKFDLITSLSGQDLTNTLPADISGIAALAQSNPGSVLAVEGPNELNGGQVVSLNGSSSQNAATGAAIVQDVSGAVRGNPILAAQGVKVVNVSINNGGQGWQNYVAGLGNLDPSVDYANWHVYFNGQAPGAAVASMFQNAQQSAPGKPTLFTEAGYSTEAGGTSTAAQANYTLDLLADASEQGVQTTYLYELQDLNTGDANPEDNFGLFTSSGQPKPVATAIANMIATLEGTSTPAGTAQAANCPPAAVTASLPPAPATSPAAAVSMAPTVPSAPAVPPPLTPASALATTPTSCAPDPNTPMITPGSGSLTDAQGNVWKISASGSISENGQWVAGGGGTSALQISSSGIVYGRDSGHGPVNPGGCFSLSADGQSWAPSAAPSATPASLPTSPAPSAPAAPAATPPAVADPGAGACLTGVPNFAATAGGFGTLNGQIYAPDGTPFVARGIGVMEGNQPSAATLLADFPGINFVRLAIYDYASPASLSAYVADLTSHGIVVELENHNNGAGNAGGSTGTIFTGATLAQENAWYSSVASAFATNPYVWFGTNNEPSQTDGSGNNNPAALSAWQGQTYDAIRSAGNNNPIMLEMNSAGAGQTGVGYDPSVYSKMTNVIWDLHFYGWVVPGNSQSSANSVLASMISQSQQITSADGTMPAIIGEYGNSTTGLSIDPNATQVIDAVQQSGLGSAAWAWGTGNPGDGLLNADGSLSSYGQQVAQGIAISGAPGCPVSPLPVSQMTAPPLAPTAAVTAPALAPAATTQTAPPLAAQPLSINQVAALATAGN